MADELKSLADHLVAELDDLAVANEVDDYPAGGNKTEKVAALEAAGIGPQPTAVFKLRLRQEFFDEDTEAIASFMAGTKAVTLEGDEVFTTHDRSLFYGLRDLPFLEVAEG